MAQPTEPAPRAAEVFDVVHAKVLSFFPDLVRHLGGEPGRLMAQAGLDPAQLAAPTYRQLIELLELAAGELQRPGFGLRLASLQRGRMFGPLGLVMQNSRTFGQALQYVSEHIQAHSLAARVWQRRFPEEKMLFYGHDILLDRTPNRVQALEQILLLGHLAAMEMTGGQARVRKVHFRHQPVSPAKAYRRYFGCEVCFGQNEDGVFFSERDLAAPILDPDSQVYARATAFIDSEFAGRTAPVRALARGVIMQLLGGDECRSEQVAAELKLHPKTMSRRLQAEGTSFQAVKDEVRRDLMLYYLQNTSLDFAHISERLGFAEQSVMTRSCRRWFSASPTQLRDRSRADAPAA